MKLKDRINEPIEAASETQALAAGLVVTLAVSIPGAILAHEGLERMVDYSVEHPRIGGVVLGAIGVAAMCITASKNSSR